MKTATRLGLGGVEEGTGEALSEMISRFGQWITYKDDKSFREMFLDGEAREAYLDAFLGGFLMELVGGAGETVYAGDARIPKNDPGKTSQMQKTDVTAVQGQVTAHTETGKATTASRSDDAPRKVQMAEPMLSADSKATLDTAQADADLTESNPETLPRSQTEGEVPYLTTDLWTGELEGLWTETDVQTADTQKPLRYEDHSLRIRRI